MKGNIPEYKKLIKKFLLNFTGIIAEDTNLWFRENNIDVEIWQTEIYSNSNFSLETLWKLKFDSFGMLYIPLKVWR